MEKLELKHLAGYLPYGLKIYYELVNDRNQLDWGLTLCKVQFCLDNQNKPILRPLSDLTKEIQVNGKKFIPMDVLCSIEVSEEEAFKLYGKIPEVWKYLSETKTRYWDFWQVEKMYEWHFDIHGLIEKGLAIDINTLTKNK